MDEIHRVYGPAWITAPILVIGAFIIVLVLWQPLVETARRRPPAAPTASH